MRVLLDEMMPRKLKRFFPRNVEVVTIQERGWDSLENGDLPGRGSVTRGVVALSPRMAVLLTVSTKPSGFKVARSPLTAASILYVRLVRYTCSMTNSLTKGKTVKTGISINEDLAHEADALAHELGVTRSGLYAMAVREFIRSRESVSMLEELNRAYGDEPDPEDEPLIEGIKRHGRRLLDEDER